MFFKLHTLPKIVSRIVTYLEVCIPRALIYFIFFYKNMQFTLQQTFIRTYMYSHAHAHIQIQTHTHRLKKTHTHAKYLNNIATQQTIQELNIVHKKIEFLPFLPLKNGRTA